MQDFLISLILHTMNQTNKIIQIIKELLHNQQHRIKLVSKKRKKRRQKIRLLRFFLKLIFILDDFSHNNSSRHLPELFSYSFILSSPKVLHQPKSLNYKSIHSLYHPLLFQNSYMLVAP